MKRAWIAAWRVAALTVLLLGCSNRPIAGHNLPVPPPATLTPKGPGVYEASGDVEKPGATVRIENATTELGFTQETATGVYRFLIFAECGDVLLVSWSAGDASSAVVSQVVEEGCDGADAGP